MVVANGRAKRVRKTSGDNGLSPERNIVAVFKSLESFGGQQVAVFAMERLPRTGAECTSYRSVGVSPEVAARLVELQRQVACLNED